MRQVLTALTFLAIGGLAGGQLSWSQAALNHTEFRIRILGWFLFMTICMIAVAAPLLTGEDW